MVSPQSAPLPLLTLQRLVYFAKADRVVCYIVYAAFTAMMWDHLLTFRREVEHIWKAKWTIIKVLFLFTRYCTAVIIAGNAYISTGQVKGLTDKFCRNWILAGAILELTCISFVSFVVLFRLHAMWGGSRKTFILLLVVWFTSVFVSFFVFVRMVFMRRQLIFHEERFNICFAVLPNLWIQWLPDSLLHIFMLCVIIWKAVATPRSSQTPMMAILYREGVAYYGTTLIILLMGMFVWRYADIAWVGIPLYGGWVFIQIAMSRLLLTLKSMQAFQAQAQMLCSRRKAQSEGGHHHHKSSVALSYTRSRTPSHLGWSKDQTPTLSRSQSYTLSRTHSRALSLAYSHTKSPSASQVHVQSHINNRSDSPMDASVDTHGSCNYAMQTFRSTSSTCHDHNPPILPSLPNFSRPLFSTTRDNVKDMSAPPSSYHHEFVVVQAATPTLTHPSRHDSPTPTTVYNRSDTPFSQYHISTRDRSNSVGNESRYNDGTVEHVDIQKLERERRVRAQTRAGIRSNPFRTFVDRFTWCWWLWPSSNCSRRDTVWSTNSRAEERANRRDMRISVDISNVERWDPGDPGPGVKESRLGRYDHWL
ncbi:hypothetical protein CPB86DRAFT_798761 [Serendipita vermifera]|nr:hypothetical protein CPB86DRAFT_798761 [Serendipita vermifera]